MTLHDRWARQLEELGRQGRRRRLLRPRGIDFCSNDYLGFASQSDAASTLSRSGASSRLLRGEHAIWERVEAELARWHGAETALMMTSGYVANEGLLSTIIEPQDWVASDELNHASIIDGLRLTRAERFIFGHNDLDDLEAALKRVEPRTDREKYIVTESLFGMEGDRAPLEGLSDLAAKYDAHLIVDEAHATGCLGPSGAGLCAELKDRSRVLCTIHTGGKALAVPGAYVGCSALLKDLLVNRCRHLIFTTALPPAVGAWWLEAIERARGADKERRRLQENVRIFRACLTECGARDYIVPIPLGDDRRAVQAASALQEAGFDVRAIRPPTVPEGAARLRISIHADHEPDALRGLVEALTRVLS